MTRRGFKLSHPLTSLTFRTSNSSLSIANRAPRRWSLSVAIAQPELRQLGDDILNSNDNRLENTMPEYTNLIHRILKALRRTPTVFTNYGHIRPVRSAVAAHRPVLVFVEGGNDVEFLRRISGILHSADAALPDLSSLERRGELVFVPFGGGDLRSWICRFARLGSPEFHLYDREMPPVAEERHEAARIVNSRAGCRAVVTSKRSLENYLAPRAILEACGVEIKFTDDDDVADLVAKHRYLPKHSEHSWLAMSARGRRRVRNRVKRLLNTASVDRMTVDRLAERDPAGDINHWLRTIKKLANCAE